MRLKRGERQWMHFPHWGLLGTTPEVQVTSLTQLRAKQEGDWQALTAQPGYTPPAGWEPPDGVSGDPDWFGVLLGMNTEDNPAGTIVMTERSRIRTRVIAGDEIDIKPDTHEEWIFPS